MDGLEVPIHGKELTAYNMVNNTTWNVVDIDVGGNGGDGVGKTGILSAMYSILMPMMEPRT